MHHLIFREAHVLHLHPSPALDAPALSSSKDKNTSRFEKLAPLVHSIDDVGEEGAERLMDDLLQVGDGLLRRQVQLKALHKLLTAAEAERRIGGIEVPCEVEQVEKEACVLSQNEVCLAAKFLKLEVMARVAASHRHYHLLRQAHGWRKGLRVVSQDILKVNVEKASVGREHQVLQVPVADSEQEADDAVPSAAPDKIIQRLFAELGRLLRSCTIRHS